MKDLDWWAYSCTFSLNWSYLRYFSFLVNWPSPKWKHFICALELFHQKCNLTPFLIRISVARVRAISTMAACCQTWLLMPDAHVDYRIRPSFAIRYAISYSKYFLIYNLQYWSRSLSTNLVHEHPRYNQPPLEASSSPSSRINLENRLRLFERAANILVKQSNNAIVWAR